MTKLTYISGVFTENTGGGCMVDFVQLSDGKVIGINDECLVVYPNIDCFWNGIDGEFNFPAVSFSDVPNVQAKKSVMELLEETFGNELPNDLLEYSQIVSLRNDFPADSHCGKEVEKVCAAYKEAVKILPDVKDKLANACIDQVCVICFG